MQLHNRADMFSTSWGVSLSFFPARNSVGVFQFSASLDSESSSHTPFPLNSSFHSHNTMAAYGDELADAFSGLNISSSRNPLPDNLVGSFTSLHISDHQESVPQDRYSYRQHGQYRQAHQTIKQYQFQRFEARAPAPGPADVMDWERTYDPYHPFQSSLLQHPQSPPPRPYKPKRSKDNPSPYWLEQAPFYEPPTRSDPFARPDEVLVPSHAEIAWNTASYLFSPILSPLLSTFTTTIAILIAIIRLIVYWTVVAPWKAWSTFCQEIGFLGLVACWLALYIVHFLPSWGRAVVEIVKEPEPLYVMFVAGRDAIGRGPVVTSGQF
ncbi:hypothetical protein BKA64DRAFT_348192 [Cadophora sp. MPI-SDFR-AT-0126]|nr:hypothetical protein BKA64DRAFT_348192 [Leotiomycetes sp. MPI-SDFR-AT-0126]